MFCCLEGLFGVVGFVWFLGFVWVILVVMGCLVDIGCYWLSGFPFHGWLFRRFDFLVGPSEDLRGTAGKGYVVHSC